MMLAKLSAKSVEHANLQRDGAGEQQRDQRQQHVRHAPQSDEQQDRDRDQCENAGFDEGRRHRFARLVVADRGAGSRGFGAKHRGREVSQHVGVVGITLRYRLNAGPAVRQYPVPDQIRRQRLDRSPARGEKLLRN